MTIMSNLRRNPFTSAYSWRVMDTEYYTIAEFSELPGLYGVQLQDRPKSGTVVVTEDVTGGEVFVEVSTDPLVGQCRVDYNAGYIFFNSADNGKEIYVDYQGGGTNASKQNLEALVDNEARFQTIEGDIDTIEGAINDTGGIIARVLALELAQAQFKIGTFTRDMSLASGNQSITGLGFQPSNIIFFANKHDSLNISFGFDNGTLRLKLFTNSSTSIWLNGSVDDSITLYFGGTDYYTGRASMDADGFTIAWVKSGSVTGTMTVFYLALK